MKRLVLLALPACATMRVETLSQPVTVPIHVTCDAQVELYDGHGYQPVGDVLAIPPMMGGYSERCGERFNVSDPGTYRVVRVRRGRAILAELSPVDVNALPRDSDGRAVITCR